MIEYAKTVLQKVSFDKSLFHKELAKFMLWLSPDESNKLFLWSLQNFEEHFEKSSLKTNTTTEKVKIKAD